MPAEPERHTGFVPLDRAPARVCGVVAFLSAADEDVNRLKAMGVCIGRRVEVLQGGDPLIVRAYGSRIGISARVARHVYLDMCNECPTGGPASGPPGEPHP